VIGGRLAFVVDPKSRRGADCIRSIDVSADEGEPKANPAPGDDKSLVENGSVYWWSFAEVATCDNPFPVFYGIKLKGRPSPGMGHVMAKPLVRGVVYQVNTWGSGSGNGSGWFKILPSGRIENYRSDPTPPALDENGYVTTSNSSVIEGAF
jgi:hypothetical protein